MARQEFDRESHVEGAKELAKKLDEMTRALDIPEAGRVMLTAARVIRDVAKKEAPLSKWPIVSRLIQRKTHSGGTLFDHQSRREKGSLRKSLAAIPLRKGQREKGPAAIALANIWKRKPYSAPHGHLVEFGTKERTPKSGKKFAFPAKRGLGFVFARRVAGTPANAFFARAVKSSGPKALDVATKKIAVILKRAVEK